MRQNKISVYIHFVWATWDRLPLITEKIERDLYRAIQAVCDEHKCPVLALGGMPDHVHLLVSLAPTISMADLMEYVKGSSSFLSGHKINPDEWFKWQGGYGAFSVSPQDKQRIIEYIRQQKVHHADATTWPSAEETHMYLDKAPSNNRSTRATPDTAG